MLHLCALLKLNGKFFPEGDPMSTPPVLPHDVFLPTFPLLRTQDSLKNLADASG